MPCGNTGHFAYRHGLCHHKPFFIYPKCHVLGLYSLSPFPNTMVHVITNHQLLSFEKQLQ